jgi:HAD superfamily hydrolase (TIGR01484 family)
MGIRLVAFDLDGTILERGELIRDEVLAALRDLSNRGVACVTATGRPYDFQAELFERYGIGAESGVLRGLIGDEREIFVNDGTAFRPLSSWNDPMRMRWIGVFPIAMDLLAETERESARRGLAVHRLLTDELAFERGLPSLVFETAAEAESIEQWILDQLAKRDLPLTTNRNVRLVQIFDRLVGKGPTLAHLASHLGIEPGEVLALGDSSNDYSMLDGRLGFKCATFDNAEDVLKVMVRNAGGHVSPHPAGFGVVDSFRAFGLLE